MSETKPKLPKVFKRKWVKALRSGNFEQGRQELWRYGSYCCLGVAGLVCGLKVDELLDKEFLEADMVPAGVFKVIGGSEGMAEKLAAFNDSGNWSFKRIASYIERYL